MEDHPNCDEDEREFRARVNDHRERVLLEWKAVLRRFNSELARRGGEPLLEEVLYRPFKLSRCE